MRSSARIHVSLREHDFTSDRLVTLDAYPRICEYYGRKSLPPNDGWSGPSKNSAPGVFVLSHAIYYVAVDEMRERIGVRNLRTPPGLPISQKDAQSVFEELLTQLEPYTERSPNEPMTQTFEVFGGEAGLRLDSVDEEPAGHEIRYADAWLILQALATKLWREGYTERNAMISYGDWWVGYVILSWFSFQTKPPFVAAEVFANFFPDFWRIDNTRGRASVTPMELVQDIMPENISRQVALTLYMYVSGFPSQMVGWNSIDWNRWDNYLDLKPKHWVAQWTTWRSFWSMRYTNYRFMNWVSIY